jgi:hypothetical protein
VPLRIGDRTTPGRTRTCNLGIRNPLLYPVELRGQCGCLPSRSACPARSPGRQDLSRDDVDASHRVVLAGRQAQVSKTPCREANADASGRLMISPRQGQASKAPSRGRCRCIRSPSACLLPSQQDSQSRGNGDASGRLMISPRQGQASKAPSRGRCRCIQSPSACLLPSPSQEDCQSRGNGDASGRLMLAPVLNLTEPMRRKLARCWLIPLGTVALHGVPIDGKRCLESVWPASGGVNRLAGRWLS